MSYPEGNICLLHIEAHHGDRQLFIRTVRQLGLTLDYHAVPGPDQARRFLQPRLHDPTSPPYRRPDVMLMELDLGRIDGLLFLQWRQTAPEAAGIPLLVFTRCNDFTRKEAAAALGAAAVFNKPATADDWEHAVKNVCDWAAEFAWAHACEASSVTARPGAPLPVAIIPQPELEAVSAA